MKHNDITYRKKRDNRYIMKNILVLSLVAVLLTSCGGGDGGELIGVQRNSDFFEPNPYGMLFIAQGSFNMGQNEQDVAHITNAQTKTVTIRSFWMDETEITNSEYRQFVYWVRDSIARRMIGEDGEGYIITEDDRGEEMPNNGFGDHFRINWDMPIDTNSDDIRTMLEEGCNGEDPLYYREEDRFMGRREYDTRKWVYQYMWIDLQQAAKKTNRYNLEKKAYDGKVVDLDGNWSEISNRGSFIMRDKVLVYPDTLCWIADFTYSYNEPWTKMYFFHPGFDNYPCVGVSWKQATAFCIWRSNWLNRTLTLDHQPLAMDYRLPTEAEWEFAARGGINGGVYPWGGYYTRNNRGCFVANFKPLRGRYADDGATATTDICSYAPNDYGLFDMAGNVAEWTSSAFDESSYAYIHDFNPNYQYHARNDESHVMKRKVIRGGSWKDIAYYMQCGTRTYEYQDSATSYIGFRCVRDYVGE